MSGCSVQCLCGSVVCVWQRDWFISSLLVQYMCCRRCFSCLMGPGIAWQLQRLCRTSDRGPLWLISPVSVLPPLLQLLDRPWHSVAAAALLPCAGWGLQSAGAGRCNRHGAGAAGQGEGAPLPGALPGELPEQAGPEGQVIPTGGLVLARATGRPYRNNYAGCLLSVKQKLRDRLVCFTMVPLWDQRSAPNCAHVSCLFHASPMFSARGLG